MSLVAFVSGRSPGLTTAVHAIAVAWPTDRRPILAELDPAGGSLAARHQLAPEPGLTSLAAAGRRGLRPDTVLRHCRRLPSGVVALIAPVSPERVASALAVLGSALGDVLAGISGTDILADCGRIDRRSPALELVRAAPYVVLTVTPSLEGVAHAQARLDVLSLPPGRLAVMAIGDRPYHPDEVGAVLQLPVLGALAQDPAGAAELNGRRRRSGQPSRRSPLYRSAAVIARDLTAVLPAVPPASPGPHPAGPGMEPLAASPEAAPAPGTPTPEDALEAAAPDMYSPIGAASESRRYRR